MCPLMPIYLSFSPVEPFSKSHIIVRSHWPMLDDGVAVAFRYQNNNRLIRNQMLFNMPFCNLKRRRKEIVCFLFILHHCKRMFCSFAFPYFVSIFFCTSRSVFVSTTTTTKSFSVSLNLPIVAHIYIERERIRRACNSAFTNSCSHSIK